MWEQQPIKALEALRKQAAMGGGQQRIEKQHASNKKTARERLQLLFDGGVYQEWNDLVTARMGGPKAIPGDGVITAYGKINGRMAVAVAQDFTVIGGSLGEAQGQKICAAQDAALRMQVPILFLNDSGGARIEEGIDSLNGYAGIFQRNVMASGVIPQISLILGPCAGGACYSPAICDFVLMAQKNGLMFITGPQVVKAVVHEDISPEVLGGTDVHMRTSGCAHFAYEDDAACIRGARKLLSYLPQHYGDRAPAASPAKPASRRSLQEVVVQNAKRSYDIHEVVDVLVDGGSFMEVQENFARNAVVGFARLNGGVVGIIGNQPAFMGGALDYHASDKMARFVRFCDSYDIPLITLVDVPAFLPGSNQEHNGIIRHGAKLLYAYSEATVPKLTLILRKAFGGAYIAMCSKGLGADMVYALPIAQIAVMGAEGAVDIIARKAIKEAADPAAERQKQIQMYEEEFQNPYIAAARGYVDQVIMPEECRSKLMAALELCSGKKCQLPMRKHGNIPL